MGLARVPFEGGQKAKHQNKQNYSGVRAILRLADLLKKYLICQLSLIIPKY